MNVMFRELNQLMFTLQVEENGDKLRDEKILDIVFKINKYL
jgi:hypothetical protein